MTVTGDNDGGRQQLNVSASSLSGTGLKTSKPRSKRIRNWRNLATSSKREFLESQGPLVVAISSRAKIMCSFFDVATRNAFKIKLPKSCGRLCAGISRGYLIMQSFAGDIMLANPLTGHIVKFAELIQRAPNRRMTNDRCIFAHTFPQLDFLAVVFSSTRTRSSIQFRRSRDSKWTLVPFARNSWLVEDLIVFESRIFALSTDADISALVLTSPPTMKPVLLKDKPQFSPFVRLVASQDELLVLDFCPCIILQIYRIDFAGCKWVRVFDLGDRSLFLSDLKSSRIFSTTRWGGRPNCIYHLQTAITPECIVYSIANPFCVVDRFPVVPGNESRVARGSYGWYLPSEFETMDYVRDDDAAVAVAENNA